MPATELTVQQIVLESNGLEPVYAPANADGHFFTNDGRTFLHVKNSNAQTRTITIDSVEPCSQGFDHDVTATIAATTGDHMLGPFPVQRFNDVNGRVNITFSAVEGLTIAAIKV